MALSFKKKEPVQFGDFTSTPQAVSGEKRLRLSSLDLTKTSDEEGAEILASCFPATDQDRIKDFIKTELSDKGKLKLRAYILDGEDGLAEIDRAYEIAMKQALEKTGGENAHDN